MTIVPVPEQRTSAPIRHPAFCAPWACTVGADGIGEHRSAPTWVTSTGVNLDERGLGIELYAAANEPGQTVWLTSLHLITMEPGCRECGGCRKCRRERAGARTPVHIFSTLRPAAVIEELQRYEAMLREPATVVAW